MKNHETPQAVEAVAVTQADRDAAARLWMEVTGDWPKDLWEEDVLTLKLFDHAFARQRLSAITTPPPASRPEAVDRLTRVGTAQSGDDRMFTVQDAEAICAYISSLEATPASNEHAELIAWFTKHGRSFGFKAHVREKFRQAADALQALSPDLIAAARIEGALAMRDAALAVCADVEQASVGQGTQLRRARRGGGSNPNSHKSGELRLGAARCMTGIASIDLQALSVASPREVDVECHGLDTPERVCFYEQDFYVLSNFSAFTIIWKGHRFDTSEAVYHWEKFHNPDLTPYDQYVLDSIREAPSAHVAFQIGQSEKRLRRKDWDAVKVDVMRDILRAKVEQHEYVARKLLATGDRELVENSWRDDYWGWGPNRDGQNMLGKLWMEVRAELRARTTLDQG